MHLQPSWDIWMTFYNLSSVNVSLSISVISWFSVDHGKNMSENFDTLQQHWLYLNMDKCSFAMTNIKYLGYVIDSRGIHVDPKKLHILRDWTIPQKIHELRIFLGLVNFYQRFIRDFSHIVWPLNKLTKGNGKTVFKWTPTQQQYFGKLKNKLCSARVLVLPDLHQPFEIEMTINLYSSLWPSRNYIQPKNSSGLITCNNFNS